MVLNDAAEAVAWVTVVVLACGGMWAIYQNITGRPK